MCNSNKIEIEHISDNQVYHVNQYTIHYDSLQFIEPSENLKHRLNSYKIHDNQHTIHLILTNVNQF